MENLHLPPELRELIRRVAAHPHGLGFLHRSYLESVAVTFGVHPFVVFHAREIVRWEDGEETGREPGGGMGEGRS